MNFSGKIAAWSLPALVLLSLSACDQTAKKPLQARTPAPTPVPLDAQALRHLPVTGRQPSGYLTTEPRPPGDALVDRVQAQLDKGQKLFEAGQIQSARAAWDTASNMLLAGGPAMQSDPRLRALFDKLSEAIQAIDTQAAPAEQASEQQENQEEAEDFEPAPIEEIAGLSLPPGDPRLARVAEQELIAVPHDLPLTVNDSVLAYLSFFQTRRGRATIENGLRRASLYQDMIRRTLKDEGVPQDLIYLAQAESGFQPQAVSRAVARGIWQFMAFTGQEYGLERTGWTDDRNDPVKSTRAAARHFRDLYQIFGDWYLVMAAYNSGPLNVARGVERTGYADFWELQKRDALPAETRNYVPIIIAMALVAKDPARYGVQVAPDKPLQTDIIKPGCPVSLQLVADATDSSVENLRMLNPSLLRAVTPDDSGFELHVPYGSAPRLDEALKIIPPDKWTTWRMCRVAQGESLAAIAAKYRVTLASLTAANHLQADDPPASGALIIVPTAPRPTSRVIYYRVRHGDTLDDIASRFGVTTADLRKWNHLRGPHAPTGARLKIITASAGT